MIMDAVLMMVVMMTDGDGNGSDVSDDDVVDKFH